MPVVVTDLSHVDHVVRSLAGGKQAVSGQDGGHGDTDTDTDADGFDHHLAL